MGKGADPYGRILVAVGQAGRNAVGNTGGFLIGEMITGAQLKVGDTTLARDDYLLLMTEIEIDGKILKSPHKKKQTIVINKSGGGEIKIDVPPLKKGDKVLCYQISDEEFVIFGKVE